jgi:hypothetical protein
MKKGDAYPPRFHSAVTFGPKPRVITVEVVRKETFENNGKKTEKPVMYARGERSGFVLGPTKWDQVCEALGEEDSDHWPDRKVEVYPDTTLFGGKRVPTLSYRKPGSGTKPRAKADKPPPTTDFNDSVEY